jgi:hypothetical protein
VIRGRCALLLRRPQCSLPSHSPTILLLFISTGTYEYSPFVSSLVSLRFWWRHPKSATFNSSSTLFVTKTNSMEQSCSWKANGFLGSQKFPHILWNSKVYCHIDKRPPPVSILSQSSQVLVSQSHFLKNYFNIILPSMPRSFKCLLSSDTPTKTLHTPLPLPISATYPVHLILLDLITRSICLVSECT